MEQVDLGLVDGGVDIGGLTVKHFSFATSCLDTTVLCGGWRLAGLRLVSIVRVI